MPPRVPPVVNVSFLKPYHLSPMRFETRPQDEESLPIIGNAGDEPEWEVEAVRESRITRRNRRKFLVKWKGYVKEDWIDLEDMRNSATLIVRYFADRGEPVPLDIQEFFLQEHARQDLPEEGD